jgi:diacylglycerol kinase (ATP)
MQIIKTIKSFGPAWRGMKAAFASENNFRFHLLAAVVVVAVGWYLHIELNHWLWIVACIGAVFSVEYLNTAIEKLTDLASPGYNELAGKVKDISAGAVLAVSIAAAIIGAMIFGSYIF